jgi:hypothetical protein
VGTDNTPLIVHTYYSREHCGWDVGRETGTYLSVLSFPSEKYRDRIDNIKLDKVFDLLGY